MKRPVLFFLVLSLACVSIQCKKKGCTDPISINYDENAKDDDGSCKYGGTGGSLTIVAKPEHHFDPIVGPVGYPDSAFIKFNAKDSPGSNPANYDLIVAGEEGEDHVNIHGMKPGKYYIFMAGYDSSRAERVTGGYPATITQESGEVEVVVPVSE